MHTPSRAHRTALALAAAATAALSVFAVLVAPTTTAAAVVTSTNAHNTSTSSTPRADSTESLTERADRIFLETTLREFGRLSAKRSQPKVDAKDPLDWSNDGCSAEIWGIDAPYRDTFRPACIRHDFGYRNFGNGLALRTNEEAKGIIDRRLRRDAKTICRSRSDRERCTNWANLYYNAVSKAGAAYTSFYDRECQKGYICLFDDAGYEDRRLRFFRTRTRFDDFQATAALPESTKDFGDKTSSVINRTKFDFLLFEDDNQRGDSFCVRAGTTYSNLDDVDFGDKASSIKRVNC